MKRDQTFTARSKVTKDLHFLMDLVPEQITDNITKRVEVEGTGDMIKDIRGEFDIYISYEKYSYDGSFLGNVITSKIRSNESAETLPKAIIVSVKSMRLYEKAWINSSQFSDHQTKGL